MSDIKEGINRNETFANLRKAIEESVGHQMKTPKDFDSLSTLIFDKLHKNISATTLKRFWGYIRDTESKTSKGTLDILAQFLDYLDWQSFVLQHSTLTQNPSNEKPQAEPNTSATSFFGNLKTKRLFLSLFAAVVLVAIILLFHGRASSPDDARILRQGQTFATYDDYYSLFGMKSDENHTFFARLPKPSHVALWGPQYHNPTYHNEGDSATFFPTITEYYLPANYPTDSASLAELAQLNKDRYTRTLKENDVRLAFMKNLVDTSFVFLGVYRVSATLSDTTRIVYRRVATEVNLDDIEALEHFRL